MLSLKIHRSKRRPPAGIVKPLEPYRDAQGWCRAGQETEEERSPGELRNRLLFRIKDIADFA
jgi:hypothetical protein